MSTTQPYTTDGEYTLCRLTENEKDDYMKLISEANGISNLEEDYLKRELMWRLAIGGIRWDYSIFDKEGNYCGHVIMQYPDADHPEIGIDIVKEYRGQGIGPRAIKMFARRAYKDRPVDYYYIRVSSTNQSSKRMIEKLGVTPDDTEDIFVKRLTEALLEVCGGDYEKAKAEAKKSVKIQGEQIYQYRYLPEVFME